MNDPIFEKVANVLVEVLDAEREKVVTTATLVKDLGAVPMDFLDIAFRLNCAFGLGSECKQLFPEDKRDTCTVQDVYEYVEARVTAGAT